MERDESASELIREAMAEYAERHFGTGSGVFDHRLASVGKMLRPHESARRLAREHAGEGFALAPQIVAELAHVVSDARRFGRPPGGTAAK